ILRSDYSSASSQLELCNKLFGISSWWLEAQLLLSDCRGGFEETRAKLAKFLKLPIPKNALFVAEYASQRVDATMPVFEYARQAHAMIAEGMYDKQNPCLPAYLRFILHVPNFGY